MCRLFETIRIKNGQALHLPWHEARIINARQELWGIREGLGLATLIKVPAEFVSGTVRCNVIYGRDLIDITFRLYHKRPVRTLKLVYADSMDYHLKYLRRDEIESLLGLRGEYDDIMIVKNGLVADTSISNLVFFDGTGWYTPRHPLLKGTCRARLLSEGRIKTADIMLKELDHYRGCKLINAMREPEEEEMIPVSGIIR